ncbi:MAG: glutathione S-transferase [Shinella sp.]|nr:MAG: glutathione S-transferase [Shinella sp.]
MKLYHSPNSPFVRKIVIAAELLGLSDRIELIPARGNLMARDPVFRKLNPSGQIPVLLTQQDGAIFDSPVICEYLNQLGGGGLLSNGTARWRDLRDQAMADAMLDAALQCRYEYALRPEPLRWPEWLAAWRNKIEDTAAVFDERAAELAGRHDVGAISLFCALAYINDRLSEIIDLRAAYPGLMDWYDSMAALPQVASSDPALVS